MARPRVIVADTDESYVIPLQKKFAELFADKIDLEIITDKDYFNQLFSLSQSMRTFCLCRIRFITAG